MWKELKKGRGGEGQRRQRLGAAECSEGLLHALATPHSSQDPRASNRQQLKALQKKTGLVGVSRVPDHLPGDVQVGANTVRKWPHNYSMCLLIKVKAKLSYLAYIKQNTQFTFIKRSNSLAAGLILLTSSFTAETEAGGACCLLSADLGWIESWISTDFCDIVS